MISLHVTLYRDGEGNDRYMVTSPAVDHPGHVNDLTEHYELVAMEDEQGRSGFAVFKREQETKREVPVDSIPEDSRETREAQGGVEL